MAGQLTAALPASLGATALAEARPVPWRLLAPAESSSAFAFVRL
jgi:hypothetical protein